MVLFRDSDGSRYDHDGRLLVIHSGLAGKNYAVRRGNRLYVSPAMMKLIGDTDNADDHFDLLEKIPFRVLSTSRPLPERF